MEISLSKQPRENGFTTRAVVIYIFATRGCQSSGPGKLPERGCGKIHALV